MADFSILSETFNLYHNKAKECQKNGDNALAQKYYRLAAEQMLKMAMQSSGEQRAVRYQRARALISRADGLCSAPNRAAVGAAEDGVGVQRSEELSLEEALERLNRLEGLLKVKDKVSGWVDQIKAFQMRKAHNMKVPDMTYHMVFTGNPGTGKTTVARLMAQIYRALGILSEGHLVEVTRADLVAGYVGQTAEKTRDVLKKAYGGVLFIDEAYSLVNGGTNDFGQEAINTLIKEMEDNRGNLVVIVAGYDGPMEAFINANAGLKSRFKNFLHFEDYTDSELYRIFMGICESNDYSLEKEARSALASYFCELYANRDENFGNARDVRNLFEQILERQSRRIAPCSEPSVEDLKTILLCDLPFAVTARSGREEKSVKTSAEEKEAEEGSALAEDKQETEDKKDGDGAREAPPEEKILETVGSDYRFDWDSLPDVTFGDIAGLESVKEVVRVKVLLPLKNPEIFEGYVRKGGGGLLLYGPPGTGKTMIAAAIANEIGAKFCSVKPSDLLNQGVGNTEKAVRSLFAQARSFPCAVVYFDEMDSISPKSTKSQYARQLRSELLAQMQGIEEYNGKSKNILFLIAATNKPWEVDSAFIRPGRFGTRIYVGLPDDAARRYIIERRIKRIEEKGVVQINGLDLTLIVKSTNGFNGSDVTNLMDKVEELSALRGVATGKKEILQEDFTQALEQITSSVQREDIEKLLEWKGANE